MYLARRGVIVSATTTVKSRLGPRPWSTTAASANIVPVLADPYCIRRYSLSSEYSYCYYESSETSMRSLSTTATTTADFTGDDGDDFSSRPSSARNQPNESFDSQLQRFFAASSSQLSKSHVLELVNRACRKNSLHGMQIAQDIVERWILVTAQSSSSTAATTEDTAGMTTSNRDRSTLELWQKVVYGWGFMAPKYPVAMVRMKEIVDRIVEEVRQRKEPQQQEQSMHPNSGQHQRRLPPPGAPTVDLLNTYLWGLSQASLSPSTSHLAPARAHVVLNEMMTYYDDDHWWTRPNTRSYMHVLTAYKNSRLPTAGDKALQVLQQMVEAHHSQKQEYEEQYGESYREETGRRKIVTPDAPAYTETLQAIVRSKGDCRRNVRNFLQNLPLSTVQFDARFWVSVIHAHAKLVEEERSASERVRIAQEAESFLHNVVSTSTDDKQTLLVAWNACLDTWSRAFAREAPLECERLLQTMLSDSTIMPNTTSFNACHYAWSKCSKFYSNAAQKSLELLQLQSDLGNPSCRPDYQSYAIVISAFGNWNQVHEARGVLDSMLTRIPELAALPASRNPAAPFSAVLSCIAKYRAPSEEAKNATKGSSISNDGDTALWKDGADQEDVYSLAIRTYTEVTQDFYGIGVKPDHHTFSAMLRCIAAHSSGVEKQTRSQEVFDQACGAGEVSRTVVDGLVAAIGESLAQQRLRDMPRFWNRNVPAGFRHNSPGTKRSRK